MIEDDEQGQRQIWPSAFMRHLRPELYSDSSDRTAYLLDAPTLEYHLESITSRNQTNAFEIFCRKLCERAICPNLRPATGPEGGGDSKADTETIPIAGEIATLAYIGTANAGGERWAFAFSAKKKWADKVRSDVAGIVGTQRGYTKIYCVTAQFARAKNRAALEDELSKKYGVSVTILDRSWIVEEVIARDRKDLAFNYLGLGQEVNDSRRLGPTDYSRTQQLEDIEKALNNPENFAGMELQLVTETLVAAKLSRNLELPRTETDGRFARAIRLAEAHGTYRQRLDAHYELIWTSFWWFDDFTLLNTNYDAFEALSLETDYAKNVELLCNINQLLFNAVIHRHLPPEEVKLIERSKRLRDKLEEIAAISERPNNALEARTSLLVMDVNKAVYEQKTEQLPKLWPLFSEIIKQADGLGEFPAERLVKMIEVFGGIAGNDAGYARLVDETAEFVSARTGEGQGALVLLKRAEQLSLDDKFEMIRLLGRAARQLSKKEYTSSLIEASRLLAIAYRSAGLLWAARASCIFTIASIFIEAEEDSDVPASVVPTVMLLAWIAVELRHLPDMLEAIRLVRGSAANLPLDNSSKELVAKRLVEFDQVFSSQILSFTPDELEYTAGLPDLLGRLELNHSRLSQLYAMGYESMLREEEWIPAEESAESVAEFFTLLASQPASDNLRGPVIFNERGSQTYVSTVLGMRVEVHHQTSEASILTAEALIGSVEALFATTLDLDVQPHTEGFAVTIHEQADAVKPDFEIDADNMVATIRWPTGLLPGTSGRQEEIQRALIGFAVAMFAATCHVEDMQATIKRFFEDEAVLDRIAMIVVVGNSRQRVFNHGVSTLSDWAEHTKKKLPLLAAHPKIVRRKLEPRVKEKPITDARADEPLFSPKDHRDLSIRSVIDNHLWNRAGWTGVGFADWGPHQPPVIGLLFTDEDSPRKIFARWRERFGKVDKEGDIYVAIVRNIAVDSPAHYSLLITSRPQPRSELSEGKLQAVAIRMQTMEVDSDANLLRFLDSYGRSNAYWLVPAIWRGTGQPEFLHDLAILKRELSVKVASEINHGDIESIALGPTHKSRDERIRRRR
jgi:hypothetical protein